ncbi:uncharacterized protein LOC135943831 [Cloeon dipterum]|uniref:uncharacterized protein LOC135943831 n=1 Tax=Cloeon dipterum TaxID=197152 RepID=UPI0032202B21
MSAEQQQKSDVQLVELTKVRLQNLARKQRLEDLALQFVAANFQLYNAFNLPSPIREKILQRILQWRCFDPYNGNLEQLDKMMLALAHLVGQWTVSVDFTNMFTFCPSYKIQSSFIQVCELLARVAPNIEELSMKSSPMLNIQDLLQPLTKMQKLKILRLGCCHFDLDGLIELCMALPNLRVLGVKTLDIDMEDSGCQNNLSRALQHLRVLEDENGYIRLLSFFARVVPHLEYIYASQRDEDTTVRLQEEEDKTPNQRRKFLCLYHDGQFVDGKEDLHVKHPFITRLLVDGYLINFGVETLDKFSNLKTLVLKSCKLTDLDSLMRVYGQNLHTLHIMDNSMRSLEGLTFGCILECCSRLEKLRLKNVIISDEGANAFPELRDFTWENGGNSSVVMLLSSLLSSPKLEKIKLEGKFEVEDLRGVATVIEQKKILRQLQSFHLRLAYTYTRDSNFNMAHFRAAAGLAKTASAFLPLLIDLHLSMIDNSFFINFFNQVSGQVVNEKYEDEALNKMIKEHEKFGGAGFKP